MPQLAPPPAYLHYAMNLCVIRLIWRSFMRALFTGREYGWREGLLAPLRLPVANVVMILAARRALWAYCRSLGGARVIWDKTDHRVHPSLLASAMPRPGALENIA